MYWLTRLILCIIMSIIVLAGSACTRADEHARSTITMPTTDLNTLWVLCHRGETIVAMDVTTWDIVSRISMPEMRLASDLFTVNDELYFTQFGDLGVNGNSLVFLNVNNTHDKRFIQLSQAPSNMAVDKRLMKAVVTHTALWDNNRTMVSFIDVARHEFIGDEYVDGLATSVQINEGKAYVIVAALVPNQRNELLVYDLNTNQKLETFPLLEGNISLGTDFVVCDDQVYYSIFQENIDGMPVSAQAVALNMDSEDNHILAAMPMAGDIAITMNGNLIVSPGMYGHSEPVRLLRRADGDIIDEKVMGEIANNMVALNGNLFAITADESNKIVIFNGDDLHIEREMVAPCQPFVLEFYYDGK